MSDDWRRKAACLTHPVELFFPERGDHKSVTSALAVCATCTVVDECLTENAHQRDGIYGGTTARQRRLIKPPRVVACVQCGHKFETRGSRALCSEECKALRHTEQKRLSRARAPRG